jgi:prevent-host-death family protein
MRLLLEILADVSLRTRRRHTNPDSRGWLPTGDARDNGRTREDLPGSYRVHDSGYTEDMDVSQNQLSVRDARAHFAELITRAQGGTPTIITRNGQPVAAVVPIEDFNALEDAIDRYFAREADRDVTENPDAPTYSMSEVVAAIFEEETGKGVA